MAAPFFDAVRVAVSGAPATSAFTIGAAISGFRALSAINSNQLVDYRADGAAGWEIGSGLWNGTTLTRTVKYSSNSDALVSFGSDVVISLTIPADEVQPHIGGGKWGLVSAIAGSATPDHFGINAPTFTALSGSSTSPSIAFTSYRAHQHRLTHGPGSTAANSYSTIANPSDLVSLSSTAFMGGFECVHRWGISALASTPRYFIGLSASTPTTAEPSTVLNIAGFGVDSTDTVFQFMTNDGSGSATKRSTGITPAVDDFYECAVWANPGEAKVWAAMTRLNDGTSYFSYATTKLPAVDTGIFPLLLEGLGANTGNPFINFQSLYLRSSF